MVAPEVADAALHATLLMGTAQTRLTEDGVEQVVGAQADESLVLLAVLAAQNLADGLLEIVVANGGEAATEMDERLRMRLQEGLLRDAA